MLGVNGIVDLKRKHSKDNLVKLLGAMNGKTIYSKSEERFQYIDDLAVLGVCGEYYNFYLPTKDETKDKERVLPIVVLNGEIYNVKRLKRYLVEKGYNFKTDSILEVMSCGYSEHGADWLNFLDGSFTIVIYDRKNGEILIARDAIGAKLLYYFKNNDVLLFSSELKDILDSGIVEKSINRFAIQQYLSLTYIPSPFTIIDHVYKLEPGSYIVVDSTGKMDIKRYWDVDYDKGNMIDDYETAKTQLREYLFTAVEERMSDNQQTGAFLSGGIDSTVIVGIMSKISQNPVNTFTVGFKIKEYNEAGKASIAARYHKTNHHVFYLDYDEALLYIDDIINNLNEPFADSSSIPTYMISKYAKNYVDVVLTGDGGDELFAGYSKYLVNYYVDLYKKIPPFLRKHVLEKAIQLVPDKSSIMRKVRKVIENAESSTFERRKNLICLGFKENEIQKLMRYPVEHTLDFIKEKYERFSFTGDEIFQTLYTDLAVELEGDMFVKADRMSTINSLKSRAPILSKEVVELSLRIPSSFKISKKQQKIILKDTFSDLIPKELKNAPKKGFGVPVDYWLRGSLKGELKRVLSKEEIDKYGILNYEYVRNVVEEHLTNKRNRKSELWALYVLQKWMNMFL